jgi:hypothetical protein
MFDHAYAIFKVMWLFIVPALALAALVGGIVLIVKRAEKGWYLWTGIGLIVLFVLTLPLTVPFALLALLLVTGGSFS